MIPGWDAPDPAVAPLLGQSPVALAAAADIRPGDLLLVAFGERYKIPTFYYVDKAELTVDPVKMVNYVDMLCSSGGLPGHGNAPLSFPPSEILLVLRAAPQGPSCAS